MFLQFTWLAVTKYVKICLTLCCECFLRVIFTTRQTKCSFSHRGTSCFHISSGLTPMTPTADTANYWKTSKTLHTNANLHPHNIEKKHTLVSSSIMLCCSRTWSLRKAISWSSWAWSRSFRDFSFFSGGWELIFSFCRHKTHKRL